MSVSLDDAHLCSHAAWSRTAAAAWLYNLFCLHAGYPQQAPAITRPLAAGLTSCWLQRHLRLSYHALLTKSPPPHCAPARCRLRDIDGGVVVTYARLATLDVPDTQDLANYWEGPRAGSYFMAPGECLPHRGWVHMWFCGRRSGGKQGRSGWATRNALHSLNAHP